jgi:hypothetical protein
MFGRQRLNSERGGEVMKTRNVALYRALVRLGATEEEAQEAASFDGRGGTEAAGPTNENQRFIDTLWWPGLQVVVALLLVLITGWQWWTGACR